MWVLGKKDTSLAQSKREGKDLIHNPVMNKGLAFSHSERKDLKLKGLLPAAVEDLEKQVKREIAHLRRKPSDIEKYVFLMSLLDRNERLFHRVLVDHLEECMPIVYTPTVGQACLEYGQIWGKPRGLYVTMNDKGNVKELVGNWPEDDIRVVVFTDGERILGLGDLGANGMGIPVGKLQLYSVCAGIDPRHCLPVCIDVGTNNEQLKEDEFYLGLKQDRVRGEEYDELVLEFMDAARERFGRTTLLQFEDFGNLNAFRLLEKTRENFTTFNDDIQGTASVALAGVLASLRVTSKIENAPKLLADHVFVFLGAGEAGTGIANLIAHAIQEEAKEHGNDNMTLAEARKNIWLVDSKGLITKERADAGGLQHHKVDFAHELTNEHVAKLTGTEFEIVDNKVETLDQAIRVVGATAIIGVSAIPQTFTESVCKFMAKNTPKPLIFALSNPTSKAECTAEQAYNYTDGNCIFVSGSPFPKVTLNGKTFVPGQGNNSYIFPALGLGVLASKALTIPDELLYVCAKALSNQVSETDLENGSMYPPLQNIRKISLNIAIQVAERAYKLEIASHLPKPNDLPHHVETLMVDHDYTPKPTQTA